MDWLWLLRMRQWAQHPPSARKVRLVIGVIVVCLALYAIERWIGWPDWMTLDPVRAPMRVLR